MRVDSTAALLCRGLLLLLGCILLSAAGYAQIDTTWDDQDSAWDDLGLDPEGFKYDEEIFGHVSSGWFPQPFVAWTLSLTSDAFYSDVFDFGENIRSRSLQGTTSPFSWHNPYEGSEREILQANSDEEEEDGYPVTNYDEYALTFHLTPPFPLILRLGAGLRVTDGMLFSSDTTRSYLAISGIKQPFKEVGVLHLTEYQIMGSGGLSIPFYGGFIKTEAAILSSYYYIFGGVSLNYAIKSKARQYVQIANAKEQIRYGNGADTLTLINDLKLEGLNRWRTNLEFGLGWNATFDEFVLGFEAFTSVPQTSVLDDVAWKQYFVGLRFSFGYQWIPGKKKKTK